MNIKTDTVTRIEVIDETGRALVKNDVHIEILVQDDGRTVKIFTRDTSPKTEERVS